MIFVAFPGFLIAAGVLAAVPVMLHFLTRRPPALAALPTARFLTQDPRTRLRLQRRPTDARLLAVRMAFALALGAAFAGLTWTPDRSGTARIVLVDAGADPGADWAEVVEAARAAVAGGGEAEGGGAILVAYGLDGGGRVVDLDELVELERGSRPATAEDGLRTLRDVARAQEFAEAEVAWVGRPSWRAWSPGLGLMRRQLWPGRMELRPVSGGGAGEGNPHSTEPSFAWVADTSAATDPLRRAISALGARVRQPGGGDEIPEAEAGGGAGLDVEVVGDVDWIFADFSRAFGSPLLDRAREGATLVAWGGLTGGDQEVPWVVGPSASRSTDASPSPGVLLLAQDRSVGAPVERLPGGPAAGARILAVFDDGTPAAAARTLGEGCVVHLAAPLTAPALTTSPAYPTLVERLATGCDHPGQTHAPLDRGALAALERPDLPARVDVASLVAAEGVSLTRWLVLIALALLGLEIAMTRERRA